MTNSTNRAPIISLREYEVTDSWGQKSVRHAWKIQRSDRVTESGDGYNSADAALQFAIGVAEGRYA